MAEVTKEFLNIFLVGGGATGYCGFCGRTYYEVNNSNHEEGALEKLKDATNRLPDRFILRDEPILMLEVFGYTYIVDCKCDGAQKMEERIWEARDKIKKYLIARTDRMKEEVQRDSDNLESLR